MKPNLFILLLFFTLCSCYTEDDYAPLDIEQIFTENIEEMITVDIIYILPTNHSKNTRYKLDPTHYINNLNGCYFNRNGIGLLLGDIKTLYNDELYDLKDNRGNEASIFMQETEQSYKKDRLNIYIMKRTNTIAIAGIGKNQRALITDEHIYKSTSPHEIGHALGLHHITTEGNIMSTIRPYLRKEFNLSQVNIMKSHIEDINDAD